MSPKAIFLTICVICSLVLLVGCAEKADLDPKEKRLVVVECILREDSVQRLYLNFSSRLNESHYPPVEEAEAFIDEYKVDGDDSTKVARYAFSKVSDGKWESAFSPKVEHIYKLNVDVPGYPLISARTRFSKGNFYFNLQYPPGGGEFRSMISLDPTEQEDIICEPRLCSYTIESVAYDVDISDSSAFWFYGMDFNTVTNKFEITEYIYSCHPGTDRFNMSDKTGSKLSQLQIPEDYNELSFIESLEYGIPMYAANLINHGNISDNFLNLKYIRIPVTIFTSRGLEYSDRTLYEPMYKFPEESTHGGNYGYNYTPSFQHHHNGIPHPYAHMVVEQVSKEYDKYLKSVLSFHYGLDKKTEQDELAQLYEYREVYTNIINGAGIFGWSKRRMNFWANYQWIHYKGTTKLNSNFHTGNPTETIKEYYRKYGDPNIR